MASIPTDFLMSFHSMEREIFRRLVFGMGRDPIQAMRMVALWLWLERTGLPNIIEKMLLLPDRMLNAVAEEAEACLKCLESDTGAPASQDEIPITTNLLEKQISFHFFHEHRQAAVSGIRRVMNSVCSRIFLDIVQIAAAAANVGETMPTTGALRPTFGPGANHSVGPSGEGTSAQGAPLNPNPNSNSNLGFMMSGWIAQPLEGGTSRPGPPLDTAERMSLGSRLQQFYGTAFTGLHGFPNPSSISGSEITNPQPTLGGGEGSTSNVLQFHSFLSLLEESLDLTGETIHEMATGLTLNPSARPWVPDDNTLHEDRTLFVTFSRGYPLGEEDIKEFFTRQWGDCVQSFHMQETAAGVQPLYARLVLYSASLIPLIMQGLVKAKFVIKGKHIWVRPYIPRRNLSQPPSPSNPN